MVVKQFVCRQCDRRFSVEVFEPGEAEETGRSSGPVTCERCGGQVRPA